VYGGALAAALGAGFLSTSSLPWLAVGIVCAVSIGLGRDFQSLMSSRMPVPAAQMFLGFLLLLLGAVLLGMSNPALLAIGGGAAVIGFFLRAQQSFRSGGLRALPSSSTLSYAEKKARSSRFSVWSSWSRIGQGQGWTPGRAGQHSWQKGNWYARGKYDKYAAA